MQKFGVFLCDGMIRAQRPARAFLGSSDNLDGFLGLALMREAGGKLDCETHRVGIARAKFVFHQPHDFRDLALRFFDLALADQGDGEVAAAI